MEREACRCDIEGAEILGTCVGGGGGGTGRGSGNG